MRDYVPSSCSLVGVGLTLVDEGYLGMAVLVHVASPGGRMFMGANFCGSKFRIIPHKLSHYSLLKHDRSTGCLVHLLSSCRMMMKETHGKSEFPSSTKSNIWSP